MGLVDLVRIPNLPTINASSGLSLTPSHPDLWQIIRSGFSLTSISASLYPTTLPSISVRLDVIEERWTPFQYFLLFGPSPSVRPLGIFVLYY